MSDPSSPVQEMDGVVFADLKTFPDDRGFFREVIRVTDPWFEEGFGQLSHSLVNAGVLKAWHIHRQQIDWWYLASGVLKVALHDTRPGSRTFRQTVEFLMGEGEQARCIRIPPGVAHGYLCLSGPAHMIYVTSRLYDPADEGRIPHDDPAIGYDWFRTAGR
jgi:dTDP-4-dehydrorhamnose 3,5-epimerase